MLSYEEFTAAKQRLLTDDPSSNAAGTSDRHAVESFGSSELIETPAPADDDQRDTVEPSVHLPAGIKRPTVDEPTIDEPDGAKPDVLLDDNGYTVTSRWVRVPTGKVYTVAQIVSWDLQQRDVDKATIVKERTAEAKSYRVFAWLALIATLIVGSQIEDESWVLVGMIVATIWLFIKSSPTRERQHDLRTEFVVKVRTANMAQSEVLVTPDEEFATRFYDAVLAAAG
jgi:hypothetical protein